MKKIRVHLWGLLTPLLLLALLTPWSAEIDLWVSHFFYQKGHFLSDPWLNWFYTYGPLPAWIVSISALLLGIFSWISGRHQQWRRPCIYLVLTLAIGSGFVVHALFKEQWGRPRPVETVEFGGKLPFQPVYKPNFFDRIKPYRSFPCGHCTMGFYFFSFLWLGRYYHRRWLFGLGLLLSIGLGGLLSLLRISQGGHFFTDTLFAGAIMWWTALILYMLLFKEESS